MKEEILAFNGDGHLAVLGKGERNWQVFLFCLFKLLWPFNVLMRTSRLIFFPTPTAFTIHAGFKVDMKDIADTLQCTYSSNDLFLHFTSTSQSTTLDSNYPIPKISDVKPCSPVITSFLPEESSTSLQNPLTPSYSLRPSVCFIPTFFLFFSSSCNELHYNYSLANGLSFPIFFSCIY